jgi:hypothetical protein
MTDGQNISSCDVSIDTTTVLLNGISLCASLPVSEFHSLLGKPTRVAAIGQNAPAGHRDSYVHYYDGLGIALSEHHYTYQISSVTIVLNIDDAIHPTANPFAGKLEIGGVSLSPGDTEDVLAGCQLGFSTQLAGTWFAKIPPSPADGCQMTTVIETKGRKLPSGRRSKKREILTISLCLEHDPWDKKFRPE